MRCGNCKGNHDTSAEVRTCYKMNGDTLTEVKDGPMWPASDKAIKFALDLQRDRLKPDHWLDYTDDQLHMLEKDEVSSIITMLKAMPHKPGADESTSERPGHDIPAGRYAIKGDDGVWRFYDVDKGKGRWDGYTFVKRLIGAPGSYRKEQMAAGARTATFADIRRNIKQASIDYGLQTGRCGVCGSELSNPESLAAGIGPICRAKQGW